MIVLALAAVVQLANAQKSKDAILKAISVAQTNCNNPKKADKPATWLSLAKAASEAYTAPQGNGMAGMGRQEIMLVAGKPIQSEHKTFADGEFDVDIYPSCKYYYGASGFLEMIETTDVFSPDALDIALKAYERAATVDPKGTKTKEIVDGIKQIASFWQNDARVAHLNGDNSLSSKCFEKVAIASATEPLALVDSVSIFNAGSTALFAGELERAKGLLQRCIDMDFLEGGDVFSRLADCYKQLGDTTKFKSILEEGFTKCPENQGILVGLINQYKQENSNLEKIISLLDQAKANDPGNASLYYVEGDIWKQLGNIDKAVEAYDKVAVVDPSCEWGYYFKGFMFLEQADKIADMAQNEFDDRKYAALVEEYEATMSKAIDPLEKAYAMTSNDAVKGNVAQFLKNIYFRFRDKSPEYSAAYEKYNELSKSVQ